MVAPSRTEYPPPRRGFVARTGPRVLGLVLILALIAWEGTLQRFSAPSRWSVGSVIGVTVILSALVGRGRQRTTSTGWARRAAAVVAGWRPRAVAGPPLTAVIGTVVWVALVAATIGWDLNSFVHEAHELPTLSRLFGGATDRMWGRALVFAAWVGLGGYLAVGARRRPHEQRDAFPGGAHTDREGPACSPGNRRRRVGQ